MGEHPTSAHRWQLRRVPDTHHSPVVVIGQGRQASEVVGRRHPGLVEDQRGPRRQLPLGLGAVHPAVLVEQLGQGGGRRPGLPTEYVGRLARRGQADDRSLAGPAGRRPPSPAWWSCRCPPGRRPAPDAGSRRRPGRRRPAPRRPALTAAGADVGPGPAQQPASCSSTAGVLSRRSTTCSVTGRPSRLRAAPLLGGGWSSTHCCARPLGQFVDDPHDVGGRRRPPRPAGGPRSPAPGRPEARTTTTRPPSPGPGRSPPRRPGSTSRSWRVPAGTARGSNPASWARARHSPRSSSAGIGSAFSGRLSSTALRSSR